MHDTGGQIAENVFHFKDNGNTTDSTAMNNICNAMATAWQDEVLPFLATDCKFIKVLGLMLNGVGSLELTLDVPGTPAGDGGGPISSQEQSFSITKSGGVSGRRNRGRVYIIGVPSGVINEGKVDETWANNLRGGLDNFASGLATDWDRELVILSRTDNAMKPFSAFTIHDYYVDVQRRRLPGHNRHR